MHARLRGPSNFLILIKPDFCCLADEIAEQRPYMNIKVTAFTVTEKSINNWSGNSGQKRLIFICIQCMYFSLIKCFVP